jgi:pimeloyl-ACP methyl ester carboxylesterase
MMSVRIAASIPGFASAYANVGGVRLHYWIGGDPAGAPVLLWHGFLSTSYAWRLVAPELAAAGLCVLVPDMRGFGDSDMPSGTVGYDARALAEEFRALVREIDFGNGRPITLVAHDMGAPPALIWAADHPGEIATLLYVEAPVMLSGVLSTMIAYTPEAMAAGSMWWWILPLAPGVPEALIVGNERAFLMWFYGGNAVVNRAVFTPDVVDEYMRTFSGKQSVLAAMGVYRAAFTSIEQTTPLVRHKVRVPVVTIALTSEGHAGKVYNLNGPELLSGPKAAAIWSEVLDRTVRYAGNDMDAFEQGMRKHAPAWSAFDIRMMYQGYLERGFAAEENDIAILMALLGHAPRTYEAFARESADEWATRGAARN